MGMKTLSITPRPPNVQPHYGRVTRSTTLVRKLAAIMTQHHDSPFRFLDLPKELRIMVYEYLPRIVRHHELCIYSRDCKEQPRQKLTLVINSVPLAILAVCRQIKSEAETIAQRIAKDFISPRTPRVILEGQDHFTKPFLHWIFNAVSEQAHRRILESTHYEFDNATRGKWCGLLQQTMSLISRKCDT